MAAAGGKIERTYGGDIRPVAAVHVSGNSIRIAESAGLHFGGSNLLQRRSSRISAEGIGGNNFAVALGAGRVFNTLESNFGAATRQLRLRNFGNPDIAARAAAGRICSTGG